MSAATTSSATETIKNALKSYLFDGILLAALGIFLLVLPEASLKIICIVIGSVLAVMGAVKIIFFAANVNGVRRAIDIPVGLIQLIVGFALIIQPAFFISLFQIIVGLILIYGAALMLIHAIQLREIRGVMFVLSLVFGIVTLALGIIIVVNPVAFADFMMMLQGIALIVEGLALIIVMHTMKKSVEEAEEAMNERRPIVVVPERVESLGSGAATRQDVIDVPYDNVRAETRRPDRRTEYYGR